MDQINYKYSEADLGIMQSWPLEKKVRVTQTRIAEWYDYYKGKVSVSFSGGKDSTVLLDIVRRMYPDVICVYADHGLDFPEVRKFVKDIDNVLFIKTKRTFYDVIKNEGWVFPNKAIARIIRGARRGSVSDRLAMAGLDSKGRPYLWRAIRFKPWEFLIDTDIKISPYCCNIMKEDPLIKFRRETGIMSMVAIMADESHRRKISWRRDGCNSFKGVESISKPMAFWTQQDVLEYIVRTKIKIAPVYGDIVKNKHNKLITTKYQRTGCVLCPIGCHGTSKDRFVRLALEYPRLHKFVIEKLELYKLLNLIGVPIGVRNEKVSDDAVDKEQLENLGSVDG